MAILLTPRVIDRDLLRGSRRWNNLSWCLNHGLTTSLQLTKKTEQQAEQTQPFSKYFSVYTPCILILCFVYMLSNGESKSTRSCVLLNMSEYDEYFKLCYSSRGSMIFK